MIRINPKGQRRDVFLLAARVEKYARELRSLPIGGRIIVNTLGDDVQVRVTEDVSELDLLECLIEEQILDPVKHDYALEPEAVS